MLDPAKERLLKSLAGMLPQILEKTGRPDLFRANAGTYMGAAIVDGDPDDRDRMLILSINAVICSVHTVLRHMVERLTDEIVITGSFAGVALGAGL